MGGFLFYNICKDIFTLKCEGEENVKVKNKIKEIRLERGISQIQMAEDLQITRQTINAIEKHKYNPSLELALKLIKYFDVSIDEIFTLEDE